MSNPTNLTPEHQTLKKLTLEQIRPSADNPRILFDKEPLAELESSIRAHNVLVPITVFWDDVSGFYRIIDGERRYRCCVALTQSGMTDRNIIPANVVDPPDELSRILFMFVIHKYREDWELMPTALMLKDVLNELGEDGSDTRKIKELTGLGEMQIERCRILLTFPKRFQNLSLLEDSRKRMPSNFWIEAHPLLNYVETEMPDLLEELGGRDSITEILVKKKEANAIRSVIHFRRVMDALNLPLSRAKPEEVEEGVAIARSELERWLKNIHLETRQVFDPLSNDDKRVQHVVSLCQDFKTRLEKAKIDNTLDRATVRLELEQVANAVARLLDKLTTKEQPSLLEDSDGDLA